MTPHLATLFAYIVLTLLVGLWSRRRDATSEDYLQAPRTLPMGIVLAAYLAANCSAIEIVGLSAMAAEYGAVTFHFYWIGAVPALIFLALWMMPLYRHHGIQSVPQFLRHRYGPRMQLLNAVATAVILQLLAGISLYAVGEVVHVIAGIALYWSLLLCATIVTSYVLMGGIRATIFNQVLQFALLLAGTVPLALSCVRLSGAIHREAMGVHAHAWRSLPWVNPHAPMDIVGVVMGLGCVLSFSYWCTDFVLMQRAFTARTNRAARQIPLLAGFGKLLFGFVVVIPGLTGALLLHTQDGRFDNTLPRMMQLMYGPWMLALGTTALCAGLMSSFAANISAFAAVCTGDLVPLVQTGEGRGSRTSVRLGMAAILASALLSLLLSYLNLLFGNIMEQVQLIFSVLGAPFWAVFVGGMVSPRPSERSAMVGFGAGAGVAFGVVILGRLGFFTFGSNMAADFYAAFLAFSVALSLVVFVPAGRAAARHHTGDVLLRGSSAVANRIDRKLLLLSLVLLLCTAVCSWIWR